MTDAPHDSWSSAGPVSAQRYLLAATTGCDGTVYVLGGLAATTSSPGPLEVEDTDLVEAYDPNRGSWTTVAPMPSPRESLAAVTGSDGRIYAIGGRGTDSSNVVEVYSPDSDTWETAAPMPVGVLDASATTDAAGNIYVFDSDTTEIYDAQSKTWRTGPAMPTLRTRTVVTTGTDGRIYVIGGYTDAENEFGPMNTVEVYTPNTGEWTKAAPMPGPKGTAAGVTAPDGRIFVFGGNPDPGATPTAVTYVYTPETDRWTTADEMPHKRTMLAAAVGGDGQIYVVGGTQGTTDQDLGTLTDVDVYTP